LIRDRRTLIPVFFCADDGAGPGTRSPRPGRHHAPGDRCDRQCGSLLGGGGVDGAIHRAAGPGLLAECRTLGGCPPGEARLTRGYRLAARFVIHTVGPVWRGGAHNEPATLARCYRSALAIGRDRGARDIAFPAIATGVYGFPHDLAAEIAVAAVRDELAEHTLPESVIFVCFDERTLRAYRRVFGLAFG
jgi:O-acetyl-ADP-ribose deacetylase